jgi:hypothetical protein
MMSLVQLFFFVENLLNAFLVLFPDIFLVFSYNFSGPNEYAYDGAFQILHLQNFCTLIFIF